VQYANGHLSFSKGVGEGESFFQSLQLRTPHLNPLPLSKGRGDEDASIEIARKQAL